MDHNLDLAASLYVHQEQRAVEHAFSVASGLDSMVLGEAQILGQLKDAYRAAQESRQHRARAQQIVPGGLFGGQTRAHRDPHRRERRIARLRRPSVWRGACIRT